MDVSWGHAFIDRFVWLDLLIFFVPSVVHIASVMGVDDAFSNEPNARNSAAGSFRSTAMAGITAVGIMIPVTLLGLQLGVSQGSSIPQESSLDVFIANLWFTLSLFFGLYVMWVVAAKSGPSTSTTGRTC